MPPTLVSQRLGTLTAAHLQRALDRFGLGQFLDAQLVPFGLFGQNVFVTSTVGEYVLRGTPHYPWQFPHERFTARLLHERTDVPVPWPYRLDPATDIFGWSYVLMPRMPGAQLADPQVIADLSPADRLGIAAALGETLAQVHGVTWPHAGRYELAADTIRPFGLAYEAWVAAEARRRLAQARRHSARTTAADADWVADVIARAARAPADAGPPSLVLRDYKEANVVVQPVAGSAGAWRVSGVFDLMESHVGTHEADLCRQVAHYLEADQPGLARAFVRAYARHRPLPPGAAIRFPLFMLHDRLIVWEYLLRAMPAAVREWDSLRAWADPFLAFDLDVLLADG